MLKMPLFNLISELASSEVILEPVILTPFILIAVKVPVLISLALIPSAVIAVLHLQVPSVFLALAIKIPSEVIKIAFVLVLSNG